MEMVKVGEEDEEKETPQQQQLPWEIMYEILTRVDLHSLVSQCRYVCKEWESLTYNHNFKQLHSQRTRSFSGYFTQHRHQCNIRHTVDLGNMFVSASGQYYNSSTPADSLSLDFLPTRVKIEASSLHGLLFCSFREFLGCINPRYYVCKPATRQWVEIPINPKSTAHQFFTVGMEMVVLKPSSHPTVVPHYKIFHFYGSRCASVNFGCEIFDSNYWSWKVIEDNGTCRFDFLVSGPGVLVNEAFHWLARMDRMIRLFHVDKEEWTRMALPRKNKKMNKEDWVTKMLVKYKGNLALFYIKEDCWLEFWELEDYHANNSWKKLYIIDLERLQRDISGYILLQDMYSTDVLMMIDVRDGLIYWYNCKLDTYTKTEVPFETNLYCYFAFQSDSIPCKLK